MAIALGGIWFADVAGADIHPSVYPGTVLALTAAALLVGTWYGRAKLLIPIGILSALLTAGMTVIGPGPYGERVYEPTTAAAVKSSYEHGAGRIVVNLDDVSDPDALDGRSIDIESRVGLVQVVVPTTVDAAITAHVRGGEIEGPAVVDDSDHGSQDAVMDAREDGRPIVTIDVDLRYGKIEILRYDCPQQAIAHEGAQPSPGPQLTELEGRRPCSRGMPLTSSRSSSGRSSPASPSSGSSRSTASSRRTRPGSAARSR